MADQRRRSLSNTGGAARLRGDSAFVRPLEEALQRQSEADPDEYGLTHGFHSFPGRMHPALARALLESFSFGSNPVVLDPFCGGGTVLIEAMLAGWSVHGSDLDPLAVRLSRVKTEIRGRPALQRFEAVLHQVAVASEARVRGRVAIRAELAPEELRWYDFHVLKELAGLLEEIKGISHDADRLAAAMVFSAIAVKFSRQRADTVEDEVVRRVRKGLPTEFYLRKGLELVERWDALASSMPARWQAPSISEGDVRRLPQAMLGFQADLVLTSPPYGGTFDYFVHHARRRAWLGLSDGGLKRDEIGARRHTGGSDAKERWEGQVSTMLGSIARLCRPEALAIFVVGDGEIAGQRVEADLQFERLGPRAGLHVVAVASEFRPDWRGGAARSEHLVLMQKR